MLDYWPLFSPFSITVKIPQLWKRSIFFFCSQEKEKGNWRGKFFLLNYLVSIRSHNLYFNISMCSMPNHCVNTRSLTRTFKKGLKIGARIMKQHSPQRKINKARSTGSVNIYGRGAAPPVHRKDIIDCFRRYGIHGDTKVMYEFLLERSRCSNFTLDSM